MIEKDPNDSIPLKLVIISTNIRSTAFSSFKNYVSLYNSQNQRFSDLLGLDLTILSFPRSKEKPTHVRCIHSCLCLQKLSKMWRQAVQSWNPLAERIMCVCIVPLPLPRTDPQLAGAHLHCFIPLSLLFHRANKAAALSPFPNGTVAHINR